MRSADNVRRLIQRLDVPPGAEMDKKVHRGIARALEEWKKTKTAERKPSIWRIIMRSKISRLTIAAAIVIAAWICLSQFGKLPDVASVAFGDVIAHLRNAKTVSFKMAIEQEGLESQTLHYWTLEPSHQRIEMEDGQVVIVDTFQGMSITLDPLEKKAHVMATAVAPKYTLDMYSEFKKELDNLLDGSQKNLGESEINGQKVMGFLVKRDRCEIIIWADPVNSMPVAIEYVEVPNQEDDQNQKQQVTTFTLSDIVIGEDLDKSLFSLSPPEGYSVIVTTEPAVEPQEEVMRMLSARIMLKLVRACYEYSKAHDGIWPENLRQAIEYGIEDEALSNMTDPESELGCIYIRPSKADPKLVVLYQAYDEWPEGGINVSFVDCHTMIIKDEAAFEEHLEYTLTQQNDE
jgi:outer membrane lipoprotein-sorting protein